MPLSLPIRENFLKTIKIYRFDADNNSTATSESEILSMDAFYQKRKKGAGVILLCALATGLIHCGTLPETVQSDVPTSATAVVPEKEPSQPAVKIPYHRDPGERELIYGQELFNSGKFKEAEYFVRKSLLFHPDYPESVKLLPWTYFFQRRFEQALAAFQKVHSIHSRDPEPLIGMAWSYLSLQFFEKALRTFKKAESYSENPDQAVKGKGISYLFTDDPIQARREFEKIYFPAEVSRIMNLWKKWKRDNPNKPLDTIPAGLSQPTLFTLPVDRPRYENMLFGMARVVEPIPPDMTIEHQTTKANSEPSAVTDSVFTPGQAQLEHAWKYYRRGFYKEALASFKKLPSPESKSLDAMNGLGWSYLALDEILNAEEVFKKILKTHPDFFGAKEGKEEVLNALMAKAAPGQYYYDRKKYRLAWKKFSSVRNDYPKWSRIHSMLGLTMLHQNHFKDSEILFQTALDIDPQDQTAQEGMRLLDKVHIPIIFEADQELENENFNRSAALYQEYITSLGESPDMTKALARAHIGLGWSRIGKKQYRLAFKNFKKIEPVQDFAFETAKGLGMAYFYLGKFGDAAVQLQKADKQRPNQDDIQFPLDWSIMKASPPLEAEAYFLQLVHTLPRRASAYMALGWIYRQNQKTDLGVEYFLKAISLDREIVLTKEFKRALDKERFGWQLINQLGWAYYQARIHDKSMDLFSHVLERQPGSSQAMTGMGYNLFKTGELEEAESWLINSLTRNPYPVSVSETVDLKDSISLLEIETNPRLLLARIYYLQGKYQDAAQLFKQEEKRNPDWAQVHDGLGWSYLKLNRLAESRASFNEAIRLQPANHLSHKGLREVKYQIAANKLSRP